MKQPLKPCPFCGDLAALMVARHHFGGNDGYYVECQGRCGAATCHWHAEAEARSMWNARADAK